MVQFQSSKLSIVNKAVSRDLICLLLLKTIYFSKRQKLAFMKQVYKIIVFNTPH